MYNIDELRTVFLNYLENENFPNEPKNLYEPNTYFLQIGGKRLRPIVLLLANQIFDGNVNDALPTALAIEYFHNFSLIHDDIMDNAPLRRNFETIHEKYNLNTAILSGDVLLIYAYKYLAKVDTNKLPQILELFNTTAIEVCEGQQMDIDFETKTTVSQTEYIKMIQLKTSVLLAASMKIGAFLGNATQVDAQNVYNFALNLGIAFQIQDDILDCFGNEKLVGKQVGGDILQNKKTLLMIEALEKSKINNDNRLLLQLQNNQEDKLPNVLQIFNHYNIKEYGLQIRDEYVQKSLEALANIDINKEKKQVLENLITHLVVREF